MSRSNKENAQLLSSAPQLTYSTQVSKSINKLPFSDVNDNQTVSALQQKQPNTQAAKDVTCKRVKIKQCSPQVLVFNPNQCVKSIKRTTILDNLNQGKAIARTRLRSPKIQRCRAIKSILNETNPPTVLKPTIATNLTENCILKLPSKRKQRAASIRILNKRRRLLMKCGKMDLSKNSKLLIALRHGKLSDQFYKYICLARDQQYTQKHLLPNGKYTTTFCFNFKLFTKVFLAVHPECELIYYPLC